MPHAPVATTTSESASKLHARLIGLLAVATILAYSNSFAVPWIFDGHQIEAAFANAFDFQQYRVAGAWTRPVVFMTFVFDFKFWSSPVVGAHVTSLAIHLAAGLVLFGIVRRTLELPRYGDRFRGASELLAAAIALVWLVHPLQTESVTYLYQRFESLMGLLYLLTLYCFIRSVHAPARRNWQAASVACCVLAVLSKEVAATAPLVVLWYDRAFIADRWATIRRQRLGYYTYLATGWLALAVVLASNAEAYPESGVLAVEGLSPLAYLLTQAGVIVHYLRLSLVPVGLCLDYGWPTAHTLSQIAPPLMMILILLVLTGWCMRRNPGWGFVLGSFFLILGPTSSFAPLKDMAFEHRMYLPLAAVVAAIVLAGFAMGQTFLSARLKTPVLGCASLLLIAVVFGLLTWSRNADYRDDGTMWHDVVRKAPQNPRAHSQVAVALLKEGQPIEALAELDNALALDPGYADAHINRGGVFLALERLNRVAGRNDEAEKNADLALAEYSRAIELSPEHVFAHFYRGVIYQNRRQLELAVIDYQAVLKIRPSWWPCWFNLGTMYAELGQNAAALEAFDRVIASQPQSAAAYQNRALVRYELRQYAEALADVESCQRLGGTVDEAFRRRLNDACQTVRLSAAP